LGLIFQITAARTATHRAGGGPRTAGTATAAARSTVAATAGSTGGTCRGGGVGSLQVQYAPRES
jgi:hypothetical protein